MTEEQVVYNITPAEYREELDRAGEEIEATFRLSVLEDAIEEAESRGDIWVTVSVANARWLVTHARANL